MRIRKAITASFAALMIAAIAFTSACAPKQESRYAKQKVVYHINYPGGEADKAYKGAMRNVQNHINAVGAGTTVDDGILGVCVKSVIACIAAQFIRARAAGDVIGAIATGDHIVARIASQSVAIGAAGNGVVAVAAV